MRRAAVLAAATAGLVAACAPTLPDDTSIVTGPRLLAAQAVPAEVATGESFTLSALSVGVGGTESASSVDWAICLAQNPLGDPDPIAPACFVQASSDLTELGTGGSVSGTMPSNACELFGPDSPPPPPGQPAARPTDPDATGGFYLPVRVRGDGDAWSAALERIACQPSGLTESVFTAFSSQYVRNQNPTLASLAIVGADGRTTTIPADGATGPGATVPAGSRLVFRAAWPACPSTPAACGGAETYVYVDPTSKQLATGRESIVASWYATAGSFDLDRDGRAATDTTLTVDNGWTAPHTAGPIHLWVVLRDTRGGVGWGAYTITVP